METINLGFNQVPIYGFFIAIGMVMCIFTILTLCQRHKVLFEDTIICSGYSMGFAVVGAKLLYLLTIVEYLEWSRMGDMEYLTAILNGGFVFYGGLVFGFIGFLLACKIHKLDYSNNLAIWVTAIPIGHAFGRIGCHRVGCCHGFEYTGIGHIVYENSIYAPNNISLFPAQALEVVFNIIIFIFLYYKNFKNLNAKKSILVYGFSYAIYRFIFEFYRGDRDRGYLSYLSTSQWISVAVILSLIIYIVIDRNKKEESIDFLS